MSLLRPLLISVALAMLTILLGITALSFFSARAMDARVESAAPASAHAFLLDSFSSWWQLALLGTLLIVAGLLWAAFAFGFVRWLKSRVLGELTEQVRRMHAILKRPDLVVATPDPVPPAKPDVAEFDELVTTIRETHARLLSSRAEQNARIDALTNALNRDALTRLVSRSYFMNAFRAALSPHPENTPEADAETSAIAQHDYGHVLVCRQRDLAALNQLMPRHLTDQWLRTSAFRLSAVFAETSDPTPMLGRLNGSDFAVLMPGLGEARAAIRAEEVRSALRETRLPLSDGTLCRWAISLAPYRRGEEMTTVLAQLDHALMRSETAGEDSVAISPRIPRALAPGEYAWKDTIQSALEDHRFYLDAQPVTLADGTPLCHDATLMLQHEAGKPALAPALFIPAAVRLDMSVAVDIQAVRLGLDWMVGNKGPLSVRVCTPTLARASFIPRLADMLASRPALAARLIVEIDAHAIVANLAGVSALCQTLRTHGARLGIRRLTHQVIALESIHLLRPAYVRLGGPFLQNMADSPGSRHIAASIANTARECGFAVYADGETRADVRDTLASLGIIPVRKPAAIPQVLSPLQRAEQ